MVFGDEWLPSPEPFISSPRLLRDEHDFVTLSLSLKVIVMNLFVTELFYRTKEKNLFVMHMFRHPIFSSPIVLFVDKIFHHSIFIFFIFFLIKLWGDNIILSPNVFVTKRFICWQNILSLNIFILFYIFLIKLWGDDIILSSNVFITKRFICWQNILWLNIFIFFFIFLIKLWGDNIISSPNFFLSPFYFLYIII